MGLKSKLVKGRRRQELLRTGSPLIPAGWRGMLLNGDPGTNPLDRPRHLENIRFRGGNLDHRGYVIAINETPLHNDSAQIKDLYDFQTKKPHRVYMIFSGCPGFSGDIGFTLSWIDYDQFPILQRGVYYPSSTSLIIGTWDGKLLVGNNETLSALTTITTVFGTESLEEAGVNQQRLIETYTGFLVRCVEAYDGKAFVGLDAGAGASRIGTWDGTTSRYGLSASSPADLTGIDAPTAFGLWRDKLVVGFGAATAHIRVRSMDGTWATVAAAGVAATKMVSYKDILYIATGSTTIYAYDGTTLSVVRTIAGASIYTMAAFNGYLYFGYQSAAVHAVIGRFDGTTWTDVHNDMTTAAPTLFQPRSMVSYRGTLMVGVRSSTMPFAYASQDQDTAVAFSIIGPTIGAGVIGSTKITDAVVL